MKKIILLLAVIIFSLSIVNAADLSDYPNFYSSKDVMIVVGDKSTASNVLAQSSISSSLGGFAAVKNKLSSEVSGLDQNIISVGNPCVNQISAQIMSDPQPCGKDFKQGKAYIKFYNTNGFYHIVVAGYSDAGTRKAANVLTNYKDYPFSGSDYEIGIDGETQEQAATTVGTPSQTTNSNTNNNIKSDSQNDAKVTGANVTASANSEMNISSNSNSIDSKPKEDKGETAKSDTSQTTKADISAKPDKKENAITKFFRWILSWFR